MICFRLVYVINWDDVLIAIAGTKMAVPGSGPSSSSHSGGNVTNRVHRKVMRVASKRHPGKAMPGKLHAVARVRQIQVWCGVTEGDWSTNNTNNVLILISDGTR